MLKTLSLIAVTTATIGLSSLAGAAPASAAYGCPPGLALNRSGLCVPHGPRQDFDRDDDGDRGPGWRHHRFDQDGDFDRRRPRYNRCDPGKRFDPRRGYCVRD